MDNIINPASLTEAKKHWADDTRKVISAWVIKEIKEHGKEWVTINDNQGVEFPALKDRVFKT